MKRIIFGLGSNLGDRKQHLQKAVDLLIADFALKNIKQSDFFANKALLKEDSPKDWDIEFLNIALSGDINYDLFDATKILSAIKLIEEKIGRKNNGLIWAPREIDIDILAIDDLIIDLGPKLQIPHKGLLKRDFFLKTFSEIEPSWRYPVKGPHFGKTIIELSLIK